MPRRKGLEGNVLEKKKEKCSREVEGCIWEYMTFENGDRCVMTILV